jgi:hypothetical protein
VLPLYSPRPLPKGLGECFPFATCCEFRDLGVKARREEGLVSDCGCDVLEEEDQRMKRRALGSCADPRRKDMAGR